MTDNKEVTKSSKNPSEVERTDEMNEKKVSYVEMLVKAGKKANLLHRQSNSTVKPTGYITDVEVSRILEKSIYRVRQMRWEGKIDEKEIRRVNRRVYTNEEYIRALKKQLDETKESTNDLNVTRACRRIVKSIEVVSFLIERDQTINTTEKSRILNYLKKYDKEAQEMLEES